MLWPGVGISVTRSLKACALLDDVGAVGGDDRQHRVGDPGDGRGIVLLPLGPVGKLAFGEDVARLGEGRHPAAVLEPRVPADVVGVQMRAHDEVDVGDAKPRRGQVLLEAVGLHHVPERPRGPRLVIAHAGVDEDVVMRGAHQVALDAQHELVGRVDKARLQPGAVLLQQLLRQGGEELQHVEERPLLLDDAMNRKVAQLDLRGHGVPFIPMIDPLRNRAGRRARHPQDWPA